MADRHDKPAAATLSVCMIVRDEEQVLDRSLSAAAQFADEIIVVDTGSVDKSPEIARKYTDHVYSYTWKDDFADARNESYAHATCDYVMWLDADDDIEPESIAKIVQMKETLNEYDLVFFGYNDKKSDEHGESVLLRDRVSRTSLRLKWQYPIHECLRFRGGLKLSMRSDIVVYHKKVHVNEPGRNLRIFEKKIAEGWQLDPFNLSYYCRELSTAGRDEEAIEIYDRMKTEGGRATDVAYARCFFVTSMKRLKRYREMVDTLLSEAVPYGLDETARCALGDGYRRLGMYPESIYWYENAMYTPVNEYDGEVHDIDLQEFLPCLRLASVYARIGRKKEAVDMFRRAEALCPQNIEVLANKIYYDSLI